jgi:hypothetical protein
MCLGPRGLLRCGSVHPVSNPSTEPAAVVERSTKGCPGSGNPIGLGRRLAMTGKTRFTPRIAAIGDQG